MRLNRRGCLACRNEQLRRMTGACKSVWGKLMIIYHHPNTKARCLAPYPYKTVRESICEKEAIFCPQHTITW